MGSAVRLNVVSVMKLLVSVKKLLVGAGAADSRVRLIGAAPR